MKTGKIIGTASSFILVLLVLMSMGSCKKKAVKPDVAGMLKTGTWKVKTVTVNGVDQLSLFTGFSLSYSATSFSATNGAPVWPATGTWTLNSEGTIITRGDGLAVNIDNITSTSLGLSLSWGKTTLGGGRSTSVAGSHVFTFGL